MEKHKCGPKFQSILERFLSKVIKGEHEDDCWTWTGYKNKHGYGLFRDDKGAKGRSPAAHRFSFEFFWQEEVGDYWVLHKCHNPSCVNPAHLKLGTPKQNTRDMFEAGRQFKNQGENNPNALLSSNQVREIRKRWESHIPYKRDGNRSSDIARDFGVSRGRILGVVNNRGWRHVD